MSARSLVVAAALVAAAVSAAPLAAQPLPAPRAAVPTLTLADVVRAALTDNPSVQLSAREVDVGRAGALRASAAFDAQLRSTVTRDRDNSLRLAATAGAPIVTTTTSTIDYGSSVQRRFRNGLVVSPQVGITRVAIPGQRAVPQSQSSVGLGVLVPLLRDRAGGMSRAVEDAAGHAYDATVLDFRHAAATGVRQAATFYWSYAATSRRLAIYVESEGRAARLLEETEALVRADERPAADLTQLRGNLAVKRATRIGAEQLVVDAWQRLALAIALPPEAVEHPPTAATDFPVPPAASPGAAPATAPGVAPAALLAGALARRADLAASERRVDAARRVVRAAEHALRPDLSVTFQVGYAGLQAGRGVGDFVGPLYRNTTGLNSAVQFSYQLPASNIAARAQALEGEAVLEEQAIVRRDAERRVAMGVRVASQALERAGLQLAEARSALQLVQQAVTNERRKFQLGTSTVFDVLIAEDNLTSAQLSEIAGREAYATALLVIRFESGTLVGGEGTSLAVDPAALLAVP